MSATEEWLNKDIEAEAERICRWGAARAGVIVVAPLVGTMALMANEVYMITRLAELRGIKLDESAVLGLLGSLGGTFVGQTLVTLIPFAPLQLPVGISVTYAVGKVANAWLKAGRPEDIASFREIFEEARQEGLKEHKKFEEMDCGKKPLGDENRLFGRDAQTIFDDVVRKSDELEAKLENKLQDLKDKLK
ncbi:MAG: hypothetical protein SPI71_03190 [Acidaminococcaceae bacterium]|nr:hypothetical protein [Acidaminococcaceae bacterium]